MLRAATSDTVEEEYEGHQHFLNTQQELDRMISSIQNKVIVGMEEQACSEAKVALDAYYKVSWELPAAVRSTDQVQCRSRERPLLTMSAGK
jgi:hypothetical protein